MVNVYSDGAGDLFDGDEVRSEHEHRVCFLCFLTLALTGRVPVAWRGVPAACQQPLVLWRADARVIDRWSNDRRAAAVSDKHTHTCAR